MDTQPSAQGSSRKQDDYLDILDDMRALHQKKAFDYGGDTGTDNLRAAAEFGIEPWVGCALRLNDKVTRIKTFVKMGRLQNESIDDSLIDIAAYAILALCLLRESRGFGTTSSQSGTGDSGTKGSPEASS